MKLNNTQIKALAQEVLNKIPKAEKTKFTKEQTTKFSKMISEYNKLDKESNALYDKMFIIKENLRELNIFRSIYDEDVRDIKKLENKLEFKHKPSIEEIVQKITLETIFETKDSMNDFIDNLVKQYSK